MAQSVGSVFLEVVPTLNKFASLLSSGVTSDVKKVGQQAGKDFGDALSAGSVKGLESLKAQLSSAALATERASTQVAAAQSTAAGAADKVTVAEARLAEARQKYAAESSQVVAAEAKLAAAKRENELQSGKTALAENTLKDAQDKQAASAAALKAKQEEGAVTSAGLAKGVGVLTIGVGAAAVAMGAVAVKAAADFQTQLTRLTTSAGESAGNLKTVNDGILAIAGEVGTSASELATGMYTIESAGFHGADGLTVLKAAAQGAKEENANLATVSNAVTDILTDYHLPAQQAADVTSKLNETVSLGKTSFEQLSGAMSNVAPLAAAAHIPLQDMLGDIAEMTSHGVSADQATQNLANTIRSLSNPTSIMTQELAQVGIRSDQLSQNLGKAGVSGALMSISDSIMAHMGPAGTVLLNSFNQSKIATEDANKMMQAMPPNLRAIAQKMQDGQISAHQWTQGLKGIDPIQANLLKQWLTATKHASGFSNELKSGSTSAQSYTQALAKATGNSTSMNVALMLTGENAAATSADISKIAEATDEAGGNIAGWGDVQGNFNQKLSQAREGFQAFIIQIGEKLLPAATAALTWVIDFAHGLADMGAWVKNNITWIGLVASIIGGLVAPILAVKTAMTIWGAATKVVAIAQAALNLVMDANPIMLIVIGIAALVAGLIYAYTHFQVFRDIVGAVGNALKVGFMAVVHGIEAGFHGIVVAAQAVGAAAVWLYQNILKPQFDAWVLIVRAVGAAFQWLWSNILQPVFNFIGQAAVILAKIILAIAITPIVLAVKGLGIVFGWLYDNAIKPAFDGISAAAKWLYDNAIKPVFDAIGAAVSWVVNNILAPIWAGLKAEWKALGDAVQWLYDNAIKPALDFIGKKWKEMREGFDLEWKFLRDNILQPIADFFVHVVWEKGIKVAIDFISQKWQWCRQIFDGEWKMLRDDVLQPVADFFVHTVWENGIKKAIDAMVDGFKTGVSKIGDVWDGLKKAFGTPIEFVIRTILNDGIIKGINWILKQVGVSGIPNIPDPNLPTFATGGVIPGYAPGRDTVHAMLSPGEGILVPQATRALGGAQGIAAINAAYGSTGSGPSPGGGFGLGGVIGDILGGIGDAASAAWNGVKNVVLGGARLAAQGLFDGVVNPLIGQIPGSPDNVAKQALTGMSQTAEKGILDFLGQKDSAALSSAGGAPASSGVAAAAQQYAASRLASFGWGADQMGPLIALWNQESGWNPNAVNPTSGAYGIPQSLGHGHPYNLGDYVAQINWGLDYIKGRYGSPGAAEAHERSANWYDQGGYLMPGLTTVMNGTGRPEAVLSPAQNASLQALVNGQGRRGDVHVHVYPRESQSELSTAHEVVRLVGHELRR